jgi:transposase
VGNGRALAAGSAAASLWWRRRAIPDRNCLAAIVYMARTWTPWRLLPVQELGCGSPSTCWRRLTEGPTPVYLTSSTWRSWRRFFAFVLVACALVCFNRL